MFFFFFFNDTATTEIYTLSLHDALPICDRQMRADDRVRAHHAVFGGGKMHGAALAAHQAVVALHQFAQHLLHRYAARERDRKSTRLNSSHSQISYAVFCLKKKKQHEERT